MLKVMKGMKMEDEQNEPGVEVPEDEPESNCDYMKNCEIPKDGDHSWCEKAWNDIINELFGNGGLP
jgi:hypothetical protein